MSRLKCSICGKPIFDVNGMMPLQIAYVSPETIVYISSRTYCKECNKNVVEPTIKEISEKLKLNYGGKNE